jgi:hypothetical protein
MIFKQRFVNDCERARGKPVDILRLGGLILPLLACVIQIENPVHLIYHFAAVFFRFIL